MTENEEFFEGFMDDYFSESEEHLNGATQSLLTLEESIGQPAAERAAIDDLFRYFHSLKGISAMVELRPAELLAHHLEHYLRAIRERELSVSTAGIEVLIEGTQRLEQIITAHRFHREMPSIDDVVRRVSGMLGEAPHAATAAPASSVAGVTGLRWICTFVPTRELLAQGIGVDAIRKRLSIVGTIVEATPQVRPDGAISFRFTLATAADVDAQQALREDMVQVEPMAVVPEVQEDEAPQPRGLTDAAGSGVAPSHVVRVDLTRLDELMRNVGDLVISRARLNDSLSRVERHVPPVEWRAVQENAVTIDRQLRTLREGIMRVRLVPIGEIFRRMPFVVRDLARETGKTVTLDLRGQSTEIDKYLIERMMDPVLHLVRNAVTHGIETTVDRVKHGKPPEGAITLSASAAGETVTIEVADDGHGVDAAAVEARARSLGLPVPQVLDDAALLTLLCAPGFSTKDDADRGSGRGVGMAVVKDTIEQLSGNMTMTSKAGEGTKFTITLPLTLAITDALIARVGSELFAVPQSAVREVIEVNSETVRELEQNELIPYREGALPVVRLARLFDISVTARARFHVFVVGTGSAAVGLAVDRIVGQREIVVRAIADPLVRVDGISGATDLGDGRVVLILDPATLSRLTRERAARALGAAATWGRVRA